MQIHEIYAMRSSSSSMIHVAHSNHDDMWHVRDHYSRHETIHATKEEAIDQAKEIASKKEEAYVVIHKDEGSLEKLKS